MTYPEINVFDNINEFFKYVENPGFTNMLTAYRGYLVLVSRMITTHYNEDDNDKISYQYYIIRNDKIRTWFNTPDGAWKAACREIDRLENPFYEEYNRGSINYVPDSVLYYGFVSFQGDYARELIINEMNRREINDVVDGVTTDV